MINRSDLIKWLNGCIFKGKGGEGIRMWALRHLDADERSAAVDEWPYKQGIDASDLADEIINSANRDAIGLERVENYVVEAYFGTSKTRGRRYTATIDGGGRERDADSDGGFFSEPAGKRGDAMQGRRHIENMHRLSVGGANETMRILRAENEQLREQVNRLMDKHFQVVDTYERLADKEHQRKLEVQAQENQEQMKAALLGQVVPLLPTFVMKALGTGEASPGALAAPEILLFRNIAKHVINNQETVMPALLQAFGGNPGILAGLKELVDKYGTDDGTDAPPQAAGPT